MTINDDLASSEITLGDMAAAAGIELQRGSATNGAAPTPGVTIPAIAGAQLRVPLIGTAPLIVHKFSQKAKQTMLDNMQGRKQPREPRDPNADYEASLYRHDDGQPGLPVIAFKLATVSAARLFPKSVTMTMLKQCLFFRADWSETDQQQLIRIWHPVTYIEGKRPWGEHVMREDVVRVGNGGTDLRYRAMFSRWTTEVTVTYVKSMLSKESVLALIDAAGMGVGVGEWRVEKSGEFGTFAIDTDREVEVIDD